MSQRRAEDVERKGGAVWRLAFGVWRSRCLLRLPAREAMLGALIASAGLTIAVAGYQAPQAPHVAEIEKVKDGLYLITGGGGNTSAFITDNGVVVIDTKLKGWGQAILTKIKSVTDKPVTMIINTHTHWDHTGSNADFPATVDFVAQENTKINMAKETCTVVGNCGAFTGENRKYLPKSLAREFKVDGLHVRFQVKILTGVAILSGILTLIVWQLLGADIDFSIVRVVTVLVIACPHALGLAVPLVVAISTTMGARNGLLVRDRRGLEEARNLILALFPDEQVE